MPIKKSELYSSLWKTCDELRGGMDASQYKARSTFVQRCVAQISQMPSVLLLII